MERVHVMKVGNAGPRPKLVGGRSPFDEVAATLRLLCEGPQPLAVDGRRLRCGLPRRLIRVDELASVLAHPSCGHEARRRAWALLVARARAGDPAWVVGAVGVALPGLRRAAARLAHAPSRVDVEADLLVGFLAALPGVDTDRPGVCARLVNAAQTRARAAVRAQEAAVAGEGRGGWGSALPPPPFGHPDLVLAKAVRCGVITAEEAELIGTTRLEETSLAAYADQAGMTRWAAHSRRRRAEARLVAAIGTGSLSDPEAEVVAEATLRTVAKAG
jgi:hypothetical protein